MSDNLRPITVLLTGCGAPGVPGIIKCLRKNGERDIRIVGVDMNENAGEGEATLSRREFRFVGTVGGEPLDFSIPTEAIGGLPITVGKHFDVYYNNRLYYVYPEPDNRLSVKWVAYFDKLLLARSAALTEGASV